MIKSLKKRWEKLERNNNNNINKKTYKINRKQTATNWP